MRILHVGKFYSPFRGGMERVLEELCEGLAARGCEVTAIVASHERRLPRESFAAGVRIVRLPTIGRVLSQPIALGLRAAIARTRPEVIHFHLPNPLALTTGWHDDVATCATIHAEADGWRGRLDRRWMLPYLRSADACLFSSEENAAAWPELLENSHVVPFGFRFASLRGHSPFVGADAPDVVFVGRLVPYKGLETLVEAMKRVDGTLAIVGEGPMRSRLATKIRADGLEAKVRLLGAIDDRALASLYRSCRVYAQPSTSRAEAFGVSALEAMSFEKPVVSSDLPTGVRSVNRHLQTGLLVPPGDALALANALTTLLRDPALARHLGQGAAAWSRRFDHDTMIDRHLQIYRSLAGSSTSTTNEVRLERDAFAPSTPTFAEGPSSASNI